MVCQRYRRNLALVRADRLLSLALLLQARGPATARALAGELGVSVRTVYRDLAALGAAGVPVVTEAGPGGGCRLMDGYRFPLRGLRPDEAEALLILGVPAVLRELGLAGALTAAHRQIRVTAGAGSGALVHLDMPRWRCPACGTSPRRCGWAGSWPSGTRRRPVSRALSGRSAW
jgi:hypothetical protein